MQLLFALLELVIFDDLSVRKLFWRTVKCHCMFLRICVFSILGLSILLFIFLFISLLLFQFWNDILYIQIHVSFWTLFVRFYFYFVIFVYFCTWLISAMTLWCRIILLYTSCSTIWFHVNCIWITWVLSETLSTAIRLIQELVVTYWACTHSIDNEILFGCVVTQQFLLDNALNYFELSLGKWFIASSCIH